MSHPDTSTVHSPVDPEVRAEVPMTHREILTVMSGLLLAMFVAMLSSTIVTNALPSIVVDLGGGEAGYTWVVVATLLTMTASTPIWGKLADLVDKKRLVQIALVTFATGSIAAGFAPNMGALVAARAVTGLGVGGMTALVMVVIASIVTPRERGRYSGYIGAVFAMATVSGPLIGGFIVDAPGLGWRWTFWVGVPVALVALVVLQRTLHLPAPAPRTAGGDRPRIDYAGALLIVGGVSVLLAWVSLAGHQFDWASVTTAVMLATGAVLVVAALVVESRVAEPIIPLRLFSDRTTALATAASVMVGIAMFGSTVYLSQYFQVARGMSPTHAGLMSVPMVGGLFLSSVITGRIISDTGRWKKFLVGGMVAVVVGLGLLSLIDAHTPLVEIGVFMVVLGAGLGATMQNLVLAVQNQVAQRDMGAASALVTFFRSIGGSAGVAALGALLGHQVTDSVTRGLARLGIDAGGSSGTLPDVDTLPGPVRDVFQGAYGDATATLFLVAVPFAVVALVLVSLIREVPLRTTLDHEPTPATTEVSSEALTEAGRR
ncbi:MDR family MFS transporter [Nocardioides zeae]|uniref:MDR family MFS transporter n=1 Tax=Nocardioides imazamoxiresistens TaxID=3231893 RepID=A0ABU3PY18_9ACTN|nr:MDR family MFS transporter [Nocardioides zeae]MDT9594131.1 MDR family MFS transporter [Nocardioides zeae]